MQTFIRFYVDSMTLKSLNRIEREIRRIIQYEELQIPDNTSFRVVSVHNRMRDGPSDPYIEYKIHYANHSGEEREDRTKGNRTYTDKDVSELLPPLN